MRLTDIEASFFRYLYENLKVVPPGIQILEAINLDDFSGMSKWVVIDSLTNNTGPQPKQNYFLHIAVQETGADGKEELIRLVDIVMTKLYPLAIIPVYDYDTGTKLGDMEVSDTSLSPVMRHRSGGLFRSMTVSVVYAS